MMPTASVNDVESDKKLLEVRDLRISFGKDSRFFKSRSKIFHAVRGIDFHISEGEVFALVGESGSGKTTAGMAVAGLRRTSGGQVLLDGKEITHMRNRELREMRKRLQVVFQDPHSSLNPRLSVGTLLGIAVKLRGGTSSKKEVSSEVATLLETVGLRANMSGRYAHELSLGQCQRVAIARALALEPKLLICDEATSSLDVSAQAQILQLIMDLRRDRGLTLLMISHDLAVVGSLADRVAVLYQGEIVEMGCPKDIFVTPQHPYTRTLLDAVPSPDPGALNRS